MPLRDNLLDPIDGDNPAGADLYYDKIFDQIKEARIEDLDTGPTGAWERKPKKADHLLVIKLAGETLAHRTKDIRLAGWLIESQLRREGILLLPACLDLLKQLQEQFWSSFYPQIDEDGNLDLRVSGIETIVNRLDLVVRQGAVTRSGMSFLQYHESQRVGYEAGADTDEKLAARKDALKQGMSTAEDFDASFSATPKNFYVSLERAFEEALERVSDLGLFQEEKYGEDYPNLSRFTRSLEEFKLVATTLLEEKRKLEPDTDPIAIVPATEELESAPVQDTQRSDISGVLPTTSVDVIPILSTSEEPQAAPPRETIGIPSDSKDPHEVIMRSAEMLRMQDPSSPAPYLICAGIRLGETRTQVGRLTSDFAIAPSTEIRQSLRRMLVEGQLHALMSLGMSTLAQPCARGWLDLHRYLWRAAVGLGTPAVASAVISTIRGLLMDMPEVRSLVLDDDTPGSNAETLQWIDAEVLPLQPEIEEKALLPEVPVSEPQPTTPAAPSSEVHAAELYQSASLLLRSGKTSEAIGLLARDAELQSSGRQRFQKRVLVAQLCLSAQQEAIAHSILLELYEELERRSLDTWESSQMLSHPVALLLKCMGRKEDASGQRQALFERLCRLDPQAALGIKQ